MRWDWGVIETELQGLLDGLEDLALDRERIEFFAEEIGAGRLAAASNLLQVDPEPVSSESIERLQELPEAKRTHYTELGRNAVARGEVAVAVLNGGMATRFGGVVKGVLEAIGERSFLELKFQQARAQGPVPFLVMNGFATHRPTLRFLAECGLEDEVLSFLQSVSLRLTPAGELFRDAAGALSPFAPGHGDFLSALRASGRLAELSEQGVRVLTLSNVDNLGAQLDPVIVGYHLAHGRALTVELAEAVGGDVGGAPARVDGRLRIVEGFCFPEDFDFTQIRFINTNTFVMSLPALGKDYPLSWFYTEKTVGGARAVQMERLIGELSAFVETAYLVTPRSGPQGRFFPVKTPEDLEALRRDDVLCQRFAGR